MIDVVDFAAERNGERDINPAKLRLVVETFSDPRYRLGLADVQPDFLGRAYEYLLRKFAEGSGQSAGEFFTPTEVGFLMAHIMRPRPGEDCHDYACGSAGLLVKLQLVARELDPMARVPLKLTGQELMAESYAVAQMNGIIHDMEIEIARGDTMINPKFRTNEGKVRGHDIVVANPMWNQPFAPDVFANDPFDRFRASGGVTTGKGDWAWLQHTLACLNEHGRAAVVLDTGAVTRGSGSKNEDKERNIRKWFVDHDLIDGVILLPVNLFYNTPAAGIIIVLNKRKSASRKGHVVLLNASKVVLKGKPKNYIPQDAIRSLAARFLSGDPVDGEIAVVSREQIVAADYNLSPARWVKSNNVAASHSIQGIAAQLELSQNIEIKANEAMLAALRSLLPSELTVPNVTPIVDEAQAAIEPKPLSDFIERPEYGYTETATSVAVGPRFLRITDIQEGHVDWDSVPYCVCDEQTLKDKRLFAGDIVIARIGATTGKSYFISDCPLAVFASYLIRIRAVPEKILPRYLYYVLQTRDYWDHIAQNKGDRLKGGVNIPVLESFEVRVPSIDRQRHIVSMLDAVEAKKKALRESRRIVDSASEALLQHFLSSVDQPEDQEFTAADVSEAIT